MPPTPLPHEIAATGNPVKSLSSAEVETAYRQFSGDLLAFLIGVLRDVHLAQDALQQTFQRLGEAGGSAQPETIRGWLFQVAYREAMLIRRREQREDRHLQSWRESLRWMEEVLSPAEQLISREESERLQRAIQELPAEQQMVVERRMRQGETFAEIAAAIGAPLGTVLTRMRLAVERLRKTLRDE